MLGRGLSIGHISMAQSFSIFEVKVGIKQHLK